MDLKEFLKKLKLQESTISMILGVLIILIIGFLTIRYITSRNQSTQEILPPLETTSDETTLPTNYVVQSGDSLWIISEKYYGNGYNWVDIMEANELKDANAISEGQELVIPDVAPRVAQAPTEPEVTVTPELEQDTREGYIVSEGDSLWKLAERFYNDGNKWTEIATENKLSSPNQLEKGQKLVIPNSETVSSTSTEKPSEGDLYVVQKGDSLWSIAQGAYGDGDKWTDIAKENKLVHPSVIHAGNTLSLPR